MRVDRVLANLGYCSRSDARAFVRRGRVAVSGVTVRDPSADVDPAAVRFDRMTYHDVLARDLKVMDASAISLARESAIPIIVFSLRSAGALMQVLRGAGPHTMISHHAPEARKVRS